ncbi:MAG: hypothetical protein EOO09_14220 [Chitinophagaceae bacterium]|nr:MAG: hypothetical protein EOO09_14220 [Chitinophagaceae bacterium]
MRFFFTLLSLLLLIGSCKKTTLVSVGEIAPKPSWLLDSSVSGQAKILTNSVRVNDTILAVSGGNTITWLRAGKFNQPVTSAWFNSRDTYGQFPRLSMDSLISVFPSATGRLEIINTAAPIDPRNRVTYIAPFSQENDAVKAYPGTQPGLRSYPVIRSRYVLAPFEINYARRKSSAVLIKVRMQSGQFAGQLYTEDSKAVGFGVTNASRVLTEGAYFSDTWFDKFFVSFGNQFYRVDTLGNVKAFGTSIDGVTESPAPRTMFLLGGQLFAMVNGRFFVSSDQGENWKLFVNTGSSVSGTLTYQNVGNELYAFRESQVWHVTLQGASINFEELDMDGLQTNTITSITQVGGYTYITTLAGLYYRDSLHFNTPRLY